MVKTEESQWDRPCTFPALFFLVHAVLSLSDLSPGLVDKWTEAVGNSILIVLYLVDFLI